MRNKIIAVNAVIVLLVGLLSWVVVRQAIIGAAANMDQLVGEAKHDVQGAAARLQLDGLRAERWLAAKAMEPQTADPLSKASPSARGDAATVVCDGILGASKGAPAFEGKVPSMVLLVDGAGRIVGRNGSTMSRGDDLGALYPSLKQALTTGQSGSDIWVNKERNDMFLASFAPVRAENGKVEGALVLGTNLNDMLTRASDAATGRGLVLVVPTGESWQVVARSSNATQALADTAATRGTEAVKQAIGTGHASAVMAGDSIAAAGGLADLGDGKRAAVVAAAPASLVEGAAGLANPIWGVTALGFLLVIIGGWLLGNYIDRPINMLEEGLLAILNGQSDKRFELEHAELGGLAFRVDQLLNQLMGVEEDTTDAEGRPSKAPTAADYRDAMSVDDRRGAGGGGGGGDELDPAAIQRLAAENADAYYARIFGEYIQAKKALGEQTDHITKDTFVGRIQSMEREASGKYGKAVRYQVKATGREVVLIAVPLS